MSTATLLTHTRRTAAPAPIRAPRRFDTHSLRSVERQLERQRAERHHHVVLNGADVDFVDRDAVDLLVAAGLGRADGIRIEQPSLAMQITLELLEHRAAPLERAA